MANLNIYELFRRMEAEDIILSFKGEISHRISFLQYIGDYGSETGQEREEPKRKKKILSHPGRMSSECVPPHGWSQGKHGAEAMESTAIFMIGYGPDNSYRIVTGNFISVDYIEGLRTKLEHINKLSPEELKAEYLQQLSTTELSEKAEPD